MSDMLGRAAPIANLFAGCATGAVLLGACGGGSSSSPPPPPPPPVQSLASVRLSGASPFMAGCDGATATGTLYLDSEVEPSVAVNPINPANLVAAWQQDRWSDGGAHGLITAASFDAGHTWTRGMPQFSRCAGGSAANGADYERASDPWLTIAADGTVYALSLSFTGATLASNSSSAMLVARSTDGGGTWGAPVVLIADGAAAFNDKGSITADRNDAHYVYAVWDRLSAGNVGPTYFARTRDGGTTWDAARSIYDPGPNNQTIGNILVSLPSGALLVIFTELDSTNVNTTGALKVIRSVDRGDTWTTPVIIAEEHPAGTHDPGTGGAVRDGGDLPSVAVDGSGTVYVVWQESAFSGGSHDGIALTRSIDGGMTWSQPVQVNGSPGAAAFIPTVSVRADGVIGVAYYDFRNSTTVPGQPTTDYWLATSASALDWRDTHVTGPFSLLGAPNANGLFLGDYQAMTATGTEFLPVFVTATGAGGDPTDVFAAFAPATATQQSQRVALPAAAAKSESNGESLHRHGDSLRTAH